MAEFKFETTVLDRTSVFPARALVRWRWIFFAFAIALMGFGALGLNRVENSTNSRAFFGPHNPEFKRLLEVEDIYESSERSLIALSAPEGAAYDPRTIEALRRATEAAWQLPYVLRLDSLTNFNYFYELGDELIVEPLVSEQDPITTEAAASIRQRAEDTGELVGSLVSEDGRTFGIAISFAPPDRDVVTYSGIQGCLTHFG
jgi:predicted RND superfamily exporter protein